MHLAILYLLAYAPKVFEAVLRRIHAVNGVYLFGELF